MTLVIGDLAPDFTLPTENVDETITLSQLRGKKVILYFYPKDNTPGCTLQACNFRDHYSQLQAKDTVVLGISKDSPKTHRAFKQKHQLPFPLLSDADAKVCILYGVINEKSIFGKTFLGLERSTFVIDEQGIISHIWRKVSVKGHVEQVLNANEQTN